MNIETVEVVLDEDTYNFIKGIAEGTGTTPDQVASILFYVEAMKFLKFKGENSEL